MKKAIIVTRALNDVLYDRFKKTCKLDFDMIQAKNFNGYIESVDYLFYCFSFFKDYEWIINIDEDSLIIDNNAILELIDYMEKEKYDYCGMPDGGVCKLRFHNPYALNPFFNIFNNKLCEALCKNEKEIRSLLMCDQLKQFKPVLKDGLDYSYDNFEPFYGVFFWPLLNDFKPIYLDCYQHIDEISTILKNHENKDFIFHTWYSRDYGKDPKRIDGCYDFFKKHYESVINKWDDCYKNLTTENPTSLFYGDTITYKLAHEFLLDCPIVEDWGVGSGGFLRYRKDAIGVDGSDTCFAYKKFVDLTDYKTECDGIHIRHVLEHNYKWEKILSNAIISAKQKICIVLFVPFSESETKELTVYSNGIPDLSLNKEKFFSKINEYKPKSIEIEELETDTQYKKEILIKITK